MNNQILPNQNSNCRYCWHRFHSLSIPDPDQDNRVLEPSNPTQDLPAIQPCTHISENCPECCNSHSQRRCSCWDRGVENSQSLPNLLCIDNKVWMIQKAMVHNILHGHCIHAACQDTMLHFPREEKKIRLKLNHLMDLN